MSIILNTNELGYLPFIDSDVDIFIIGLKGCCVNQKYTLSLNKLKEAIKNIKDKNKQIYVSINLFALEKNIKKIKQLIPKTKDLDIDGYIVSDLGVLNVFKQNHLENKVILDLHTYVTNKYSAKSLLDLGVKRITISKEITLQDIIDISSYNNGKIEVLAQGYNPITYSKRPILNCYYNKYNLKKNNNLHYIKEESRNNYYLLDEQKDNLIVYNDKQYSLFPYLKELINANIKDFKIDANYLVEKEIKDYISMYNKAINALLSESINEYENLKENFERTYTFDNPFIVNSSFLLKEEK